MPDKQLLEQDAFLALRDGEERVLLYFFNRYYSPLVLFSSAITHNYEASQDITSETFHKLWQNRSQLTHAASIKAYLYRIVHNASIDYLRWQKAEKKRAFELYSITDGKEEDILHKMVESELYDQLYQSLNQLHGRSRRIFELFYFEGKSLQEIGEELGMSAAAVKSQKNRAMQILRENKGSLFFFVCAVLSYFS